MRKCIESTLAYIGLFLSSMIVGNLVYAILNIAISAAISEGILKNLLSVLTETAGVCVFLYIAIRIYGYKGNKIYEKNLL